MQPSFKFATVEKIVVALLASNVTTMRQQGLTDRAIARKLNLPRWIVRAVE